MSFEDVAYWTDRIIASALRNLAAEWHFLTIMGIAFALSLFMDLWRRRNLRQRYLSRNFRVDLTYAGLDLAHVPHFFILVPLGTLLAGWLKANAAWMEIEAASSLPLGAQLLLAFLLLDFWVYWWHRPQHFSSVFWQFHKTHHSQEVLNPLTVFRITVIDRIIMLLVFALPPVILDIRFEYPLAMLMLIQLHQLIIHSDTGWNFGPLEKIFISPTYHEVHHSIAPEHRDRNFGGALVIWDHLFGTYAERSKDRLEYGLVGERIPESYLRQFFVPIAGLFALARVRFFSSRQTEPEIDRQVAA